MHKGSESSASQHGTRSEFEKATKNARRIVQAVNSLMKQQFSGYPPNPRNPPNPEFFRSHDISNCRLRRVSIIQRSSMRVAPFLPDDDSGREDIRI
jgi:hypothetical protein